MNHMIKWQDLLKALLVTMPLSECNDTLLNWNREMDLIVFRDGLHEGQLCAYDPQARNDSCQGDSGGALHVYCTDSNVTQVIGIVSFGIGCDSTLRSIYTRVVH